jgi:hypothetical protein
MRSQDVDVVVRQQFARRSPSRLLLVVDLCYLSSVGLGVPCEVDATRRVRRKGEFLTAGSMTLTRPVTSGYNGTFWGDKGRPSAFSFVGGFAV